MAVPPGARAYAGVRAGAGGSSVSPSPSGTARRAAVRRCRGRSDRAARRSMPVGDPAADQHPAVGAAAAARCRAPRAGEPGSGTAYGSGPSSVQRSGIPAARRSSDAASRAAYEPSAAIVKPAAPCARRLPWRSRWHRPSWVGHLQWQPKASFRTSGRTIASSVASHVRVAVVAIRRSSGASVLVCRKAVGRGRGPVRSGPSRPGRPRPVHGREVTFHPCPHCPKSSPRSTPSGPPSGPRSGTPSARSAESTPDAEVSRVLFAVDPVQEVADEAVKLGADLLVTHHPLYLRGTTTVAATTFKGRVVHTLIKHDIALHVAHTNADRADPGVSDALAGALDLRVTGPLVPDPTDPAGRRGLGRICELDRPDDRSREFAARAAARLPATAQGSASPATRTRSIRTVAVCGGSGDSLFDDVRAAGVDAFLTADLRHHPASEARAAAAPLGAARRRALGHRVALVRAGRRPARRDLRPARLGPAHRMSRARSPTPGPPTRRLTTAQTSPHHQEPPTERRARRPDPTPRRPGPRRRVSRSSRTSARPPRARRDRVAARPTSPSCATCSSPRRPRRATPPASRPRPSRTSTRCASAPPATSSAWTPARSPPRRTWRTSSARSPRSPSARATWRTSSWRSWSAASPRRSASPSSPAGSSPSRPRSTTPTARRDAALRGDRRRGGDASPRSARSSPAPSPPTCSSSTTSSARSRAASAPPGSTSGAARAAGWSSTSPRSTRCGRPPPTPCVRCENCRRILVRTPESGL